MVSVISEYEYVIGLDAVRSEMISRPVGLGEVIASRIDLFIGMNDVRLFHPNAVDEQALCTDLHQVAAHGNDALRKSSLRISRIPERHDIAPARRRGESYDDVCTLRDRRNHRQSGHAIRSDEQARGEEQNDEYGDARGDDRDDRRPPC